MTTMTYAQAERQHQMNTRLTMAHEALLWLSNVIATSDFTWGEDYVLTESGNWVYVKVALENGASWFTIGSETFCERVDLAICALAVALEIA